MTGFSKFPWLKRTHGHPFTGPEFRVLVSIFNHADGKTGRKSHPGLDLLTEETGYRRTGISEAVSGLKAKGWIHETYRGNGKARKASVFDLVPDAPNPAYRCPEAQAGQCSTCSNSSAIAEPLPGQTEPNSSARAEPCDSNGSGTGNQVPGEMAPMVPPERTPSDPRIRSESGPKGPPLDPFQSSGNEDRNRDPFESEPIGVGSSVLPEQYEGGLQEPPRGRPDSEGLPTGGEDDRRDDDESSRRESEGDEPKAWVGFGLDPWDPRNQPTESDSGDPRDPFSKAWVAPNLRDDESPLSVEGPQWGWCDSRLRRF